MTQKTYPKTIRRTPTYTVTVISTGDVIDVPQGPFVDSWVDEVTGGENPRWRELVKRGEQAGTTLTGTLQTYSLSPAYIKENSYSKYSGQHARSAETFGEYPTLPGSVGPGIEPSWTLADNRALEQYVNRVRSLQTTFQGGVFLGELGRVISMVKSPAKSLRRGMDLYLGALKKRRPKVPSRVSKDTKRRIMSDTWLEYSFGWIPLINDIEDGIKTINNSHYYRRHDLKSVRAEGTDKTVKHIDGTLGTATPPYFEGTFQVKRERTVKYYGVVDAGSNAVTNFRRIGLDLSNFVPTAWELLPWSFLVDYFSNIGTIVSAASLAQSSLRWTMRLDIETETTEFTGWYPKLNASAHFIYKVEQYYPGRSVTTVRTINRFPFLGGLVPSLEFSIPGFGTKWLNMAALSMTSRSLGRFYA